MENNQEPGNKPPHRRSTNFDNGVKDTQYLNWAEYLIFNSIIEYLLEKSEIGSLPYVAQKLTLNLLRT